MGTSQTHANQQIEQLVAGSLETLARFSNDDAEGLAGLHLRSARLLDMLLAKIKQVQIYYGPMQHSRSF